MTKLNVFKHFILTRYNTQQQDDGSMLYDDMKEANKWMESRISLFEKTRKSVLDQEVANGTLTQDQANLIEAEL